MAAPEKKDGRDRTLGTLTLADMLAKLRWEVSEFKRLSESTNEDPNLPARYMAQNAASTAWHMTDWLVDYLDDKDLWPLFSEATAPVPPNKHNVKSWIRGSYAMLVCQQIAFAMKHVRIDDHAYEDGIFTEDTFLDVFGEVDEAGNVTRVSHTESKHYAVHKVVLKNAGKFSGTYELWVVLDTALAFWERLVALILS